MLFYGFGNGFDVGAFGVNVQSGRVPIYLREDLGRRLGIPSRTPVAAPAGVIHDPPNRDISIFICIGALGEFFATLPFHKRGLMAANGAVAGIFGFALAVKEQERPQERL